MIFDPEIMFSSVDVNLKEQFFTSTMFIKKENTWDENETSEQTHQVCPYFQFGPTSGTEDWEWNEIDNVEKYLLNSEIETSLPASMDSENSNEGVYWVEPNFETSIILQDESLDEEDLFTQMVHLGIFQLASSASDCQENASFSAKLKRRRSSGSSCNRRYDDGLIWKIGCQIFEHVSILYKMQIKESHALELLIGQAYRLAIAGRHPPIPAEEEYFTPLLLQVCQGDGTVSRVSDSIQKMQIVTHGIIKQKMRMTQLRVYINIFSSNWSQDIMEQMQKSIEDKETSSQEEDINWVSLTLEENDCEKKESSLDEDELFSQMVKSGAFQCSATNLLSRSKKNAKGMIYISRTSQILMEKVYQRIIDTLNSMRNIVGKNRSSLQKLIQQAYRIAENLEYPSVPIEEPEATLPLLEVMQIEGRLPFPLKQILYLIRKLQVIYFKLMKQKMRITQLRTFIIICGHQPADNVEPNLEPFSL